MELRVQVCYWIVPRACLAVKRMAGLALARAHDRKSVRWQRQRRAGCRDGILPSLICGGSHRVPRHHSTRSRPRPRPAIPCGDSVRSMETKLTCAALATSTGVNGSARGWPYSHGESRKVESQDLMRCSYNRCAASLINSSCSGRLRLTKLTLHPHTRT